MTMANRRKLLTKRKSGLYCCRRDGKTLYWGRDKDKAEAAYLAWEREQGTASTTMPVKTTWAGFTRCVLDGKATECSPATVGNYAHCLRQCGKHVGDDTMVSSITTAEWGSLRSKLAEGVNAKTLHSRLLLLRSALRYGIDRGLIGSDIPWRLLKLPTVGQLRREKFQKRRCFTTEELTKILFSKGERWVRLCAFLGFGNGLGVSDLQALEPRHIVDRRWLVMARTKTGTYRRSLIFPEALALADSLGMPPVRTPKGQDLVTIRRRANHATTRTDLLGKAWRTHLEVCGVEHLGFSALRRTLGALGSRGGDTEAVRAVLGHIGGDVSSEFYSVGVSDGRLADLSHQLRTMVLPESPYGGSILREVR
jgi:integrase